MSRTVSLDQVAIRLIGTVAIVRPSVTAEVGRPRQRAVLAALALRAGRTVTRTELLSAIWGANPPASSSGNLHTYVAGLRRLLGARAGEEGVLLTAPHGYRLALSPHSIDVLEFDRLCKQVSQDWSKGEIAACLTASDDAAAAWRGAPLPGVSGPMAQLERTRLEAQWLKVRRVRAQAMLAANRYTDAVVECMILIRDYPLDEQVTALLSQSLYRSGRVAEALGALNDLRKRLRDELGVRPGPDVTELYEQMLAGDLRIDAATAPGTPGAGTSHHPSTVPSGSSSPARLAAPAQLPHRPWLFTGRDAELGELVRLPHRSVLISGYAGIGKTALAVTFAHDVAAGFPAGQLYLDLQGSSPSRLAPVQALSQLLGALGVAGDDLPATAAGLAAKLRGFLDTQRFLIVLDDAADADHVAPLLEVCENSAVVVTSRYRMPALKIERRMVLSGLSLDASTELLMSGCGTPLAIGADDPTVGRLVEGCNGVPLALRVAAVRLGAGAADSAVRLAELTASLNDQTSRLAAFSLDDPAVSLLAGLERTFHQLPTDAAQLLSLMSQGSGIDSLHWPIKRSERALDALTDACFLDEIAKGEYVVPDIIGAYGATSTPLPTLARQP